MIQLTKCLCASRYSVLSRVPAFAPSLSSPLGAPGYRGDYLCRAGCAGAPQQERHVSRQVVLVCVQLASLTAKTSDTRPQEKSIQSLKETPWTPSWLHTPPVCRPTPKHLFVHFPSTGIPVTSHTWGTHPVGSNRIVSLTENMPP